MSYNPAFVPREMERSDPMASMRNVDIEEYANGVVHPVTNETLKSTTKSLNVRNYVKHGWRQCVSNSDELHKGTKAQKVLILWNS